MNQQTMKKDNTVILSDKYLSESGVQGGKVIAEHLALGSFIFGGTFLVIGISALILLIGFGFPLNMANIILVVIVFVIGALLTMAGYFVYRDQHGTTTTKEP